MNLLDKASIILTPSAYNNGEALCVKPSDASGDFQFSRNSAATRVNAQGLVEDVQILSGNLIVNGDFSDGSTGWTITGTGWSIGDGKLTGLAAEENVTQAISTTVGKKYKLKFTILDWVSGDVYVRPNNMAGTEFYVNGNGDYIEEFTAINTSPTIVVRARPSQPFSGSITNFSVIEITDDTNLPRISYENFSYDGSGNIVPDSGCGSWLFEPQSTNLITYSEDYSQWTPTGVSVTLNSTTSPDGLTNGALLSTNGGTSARYIRNFGLPTSVTVKVLSVYAKANLSNFIQLVHSGDGQGYINFDVSNGVVGTSGTKTSGEIQSVGNGWYRCIAYFDSTNVFGTSSFVALVASNSVGYGGGATSDSLNVYIWGSQYEEQSYATSYIPTSGTSVTRNQDVCINGGSVSTINSTEGVLYAEIAALADDLNIEGVSISDGSTSNRVVIFKWNSSNTIRARISANGVNVLNQTISVTNITDFNKIAISYKLNDFKVYINGINVFNDTSGATPIGLNTLSFSTDGTSSTNFYGKTKALAVWKEALSDEELTLLTTI